MDSLKDLLPIGSLVRTPVSLFIDIHLHLGIIIRNDCPGAYKYRVNFGERTDSIAFNGRELTLVNPNPTQFELILYGLDTINIS